MHELLLTLLTSLLLLDHEVVSSKEMHVDVGNIRLLPCQKGCDGNDPAIGTLQIFYGTDKNPPKWRPVCSDGVNDRGFDAICSMMGYSTGQAVSPSMEASMLFSKSTDWALTELDCAVPMSNGAPPNHLLRCRYERMKSGGTCGQSINMMCSGPKGNPLSNSDYSYEGQVQLCPPDETFSPSVPAKQISFGIVSINHGGVWGSLNENGNQMVGYNQANSVCKQLGFTGAVRDSTRTVSSFGGQYNFTHCQRRSSTNTGLQRVWLKVPETSRCDSNVGSCFSCCYERRQDTHQCNIATMVDGQCPEGYCCKEDDVVLECIFDVTAYTPPISGTKEHCEFPEGQNFLSMSSTGCSTQCAAGYSEQQLLAGILVPTVALVFVLGGIAWFFGYRKYRYGGYEVVDGDNGGVRANRNEHRNRGNENGGNGNGNGGNGNGNGGNGNGGDGN